MTSRPARNAARLLVVLACVGLPGRVVAQLSVTLDSSQRAVSRLAPNLLNTNTTFHIDSCDNVTFHVVSTRPGLITSIVAAGGTIITPSTVQSIGGEYSSFVASADADTNGNARIDLSPNEFAALLIDAPELGALGSSAARDNVDAVYQVLRIVRSAKVEQFGDGLLTLQTVVGAGIGNDTLVTVESGDPIDLSFPNVRHRFLGSAGRNHSNVADAGAASFAIDWIRSVDEDFGDLRPR